MTLETIYLDVEQRLKSLDVKFLAKQEKRVEDYQLSLRNGFTQKWLVGSGVIGASLISYGLSDNNNFVTCGGIGLLISNAQIAFDSYILPKLVKRWKRKYSPQ